MSRLLANLARLPLLQVARHNEDTVEAHWDPLELTRLQSARRRLERAQLWIDAGGPTDLPLFRDDAPWPRAVIVDDIDLVMDGTPGKIRALADDGALVVASLPLHRLVDGAGDLRPGWARVADVILEVRALSQGPRESASTLEAEMSVLKHRRGPLTSFPVAFQGMYARFRDLKEPPD